MYCNQSQGGETRDLPMHEGLTQQVDCAVLAESVAGVGHGANCAQAEQRARWW